jgi:hypothetical protein
MGRLLPTSMPEDRAPWVGPTRADPTWRSDPRRRSARLVVGTRAPAPRWPGPVRLPDCAAGDAARARFHHSPLAAQPLTVGELEPGADIWPVAQIGSECLPVEVFCINIVCQPRLGVRHDDPHAGEGICFDTASRSAKSVRASSRASIRAADSARSTTPRPIVIRAFYGAGAHHPHLQGGTVGDRPLNVFDMGRAAALLPTLRDIASAEIHNLVFQADYRIIPAVVARPDP